ncbi:YbhB/YbcL family Raf kinase inhibitor-like protein [Luteimonas sp. MC1825]|uniref:YbhB/YbcL family Raf kinase inhibitor-like protein n=1 Tax=Luteimonas sp. MC1825 TaxID=2761107 RepID=UPI0016185F24|nr:YbhB/YbcL family Raf kinase inhibitor-like protein [Luteimonas sp. MC1825]MBB6598109.1 YbhB/YbcL family Raf kinase inhibitor-like protein [Luteimonas sp. MC1825]QOC88343.1 YbhB/YbcL family Raf kinase inhibitor-like protein [Luteimonas sp. MC1825]
MQISSDDFQHGQPLGVDFALGAADGFGGNRNPQLSWRDAPAGTRSFALLCIDTDAPTDAALVGAPGVEIPVEHPRGDFIHWVMVDIPADVGDIATGSCSDGVDARGKRAPAGPAGARQGLNDYTGWFAGNADMAGDWFGYDGPYPPANDLREHRYFFRVFALDVASLGVGDRFTGGDALRAMQGHVLAEAATWGSYSLHAAA